MIPVRSCPPPALFRTLLEGMLREEEESQLIGHVDRCTHCQQELEHQSRSFEQGLNLGQPTRPLPLDHSLHQAMQALKGAAQESLLPQGVLAREAGATAVLPGIPHEGWIGAYEIREVLGCGGMGIVFKAFDPSLDRLVALKVLASHLVNDSSARKRFAREGRAAAAVRHEHIVEVHAVDEVEGVPYLVMEYVPGLSLQEHIDRDGPLAIEAVVRVGMQTAAGLAAAQARGLIHRDIKPANLLLEEETGRVKITDFGLARVVDDVSLTWGDAVAGTPQYMAPEQARGETVDHRADLFSLGSVLYTCCTGTPPFHGATALALLREVSEAEPVPIRSLRPEVPPWLETFIARLMAKAPAERFQSAAEVVQLLEGYLAHLRQPELLAPPLPARDQAAPDSPRRCPPWRRSSFWMAVALVALASLGLVRWLAAGANQPTVSGSEGVNLDFRGGKLPPEGLTSWEGSDHEVTIEPEEKGLHISLPAGHHHKWPVGLRVNTTVKGDFEITGGFEIVHAETPRQGAGVGYEIYIPADSPAKDAIAFARVRLRNGQDEYICTQMRKDAQGETKYQFARFKAGSTSGRLRLTRRGSHVTYSVAEADGGEFQELCRHPYCSDDLKSVRLAAYPGMAPEAVDVRLVDARIRSDKPIVMPAKGAVPTVGLKKGLALLFVLLLVLSLGLGAWLLWSFRKRASAQEPELPASEEKAPATAPPRVVPFSCPGCKTNVKARASLAGKKVKCPQCGTVLRVPADDAVQANRPL